MFRSKDDFVGLLPEWRFRKYLNSSLPYAVSLWNNLDEIHELFHIIRVSEALRWVMLMTILLLRHMTGSNHDGETKNALQQFKNVIYIL